MTEMAEVVEMKTGSPGSEPVDQGRIDAAVKWLRHYKDSTSRTWDEVGRELASEHQQNGYSGSSLSVLASGKYNGSPAQVVRAIENLQSLVEDRLRTISFPEFSNTSSARRVFRAIRKTVLLNRIGIIAGESGTGKTCSIKQYVASAPKAIYMLANPTLSAKSFPLIARLCAALGQPRLRQTPAHAYMTLVELLEGTGRVLIIDEAQLLGADSLNQLRILHEEADVPLVLSGNETLYELSQRGAGGQAAFVQFESRCAVRERLRTTDITPDDVQQVAEQLVGAALARDARDLLLKQARSAGGIRRLVVVLQLAQTYRINQVEPVTKSYVLRAIEELAGGAS